MLLTAGYICGMKNQQLNTGSLITHLVCSKCNAYFDHQLIQTYSTCCNVPLSAVYNLSNQTIQSINATDFTMWRYQFVLPILDTGNIVSLNEGFTPISQLKKLSNIISIDSLYLKMKQ